MTISIILGVVAGIATYVFLFNLIFPNPGDFKECVYYYFKPDLFSAMKGEYFKDQSRSFQLGIWMISGGLVGAGVGAAVFQLIG